MDKIKQQAQNTATLHRNFYQALDISQASQILSEFEKGQQHEGPKFRYPLLGEGSFCSAFKVAASASPNYSFALCIAHTPYLGPSNYREQKYLHLWRKRLLNLQPYDQTIPLFPPLAFIQEKTLLAWLTPYGDSDMGSILAQWQPLTEPIAAMHTALASRSLRLGDVLQLRHWRGIPFVCDLSDLFPLHNTAAARP